MPFTQAVRLFVGTYFLCAILSRRQLMLCAHQTTGQSAISAIPLAMWRVTITVLTTSQVLLRRDTATVVNSVQKDVYVVEFVFFFQCCHDII